MSPDKKQQLTPTKQGDFPAALQTLDDCLKLAGADESLHRKATEMHASFAASKVWTDGR